MKIKNLIAVAALLLGSTNASAQRNVGDVFPADAYVYEVLATMDGTEPGEVALIGIRDGWTASETSKALIQDGALVIPNDMSADLFGETYTFNVTQLGVTVAQAAANPALTAYSDPLQTRLDATGAVKGTFTGTSAAKRIEFPAHIKEIPENCFNGWTNVNSITFAAGSELETINNYAFATTQITKFDFSPCSQLAALPDEVFVEAGKTNSYITSVTLPDDSKLLKDIQGAFKHLPNLTEIKNLEKTSITKVVALAFDGDAKLTKVELPGTVQTIAANAFGNCGVKELTINVDALTEAGDGTTPVYGTNVTKLEKLTLKGNLGGVIKKNAFKGSTALATLDLSGLNFASLGQIATSAFEGCTAITSVTIGVINDQPASGATIDADAFKDCTALATVTVGDIMSGNAIGARAFGTALKTVKIGTVKAGKAAVLANAFTFANVKGATLEVAKATGKFVSSDDALTPIFATDAFNFDAIDGSLTGWVTSTDAAVVSFGEIRSKGGVFAGGDVSGSYIREINFTGNIAEGGIDAQIYDNGANAVALVTINFNGNLATKAIEKNAFANLATQAVTVTFAGSLAKEAIMDGAFELMKGATAKASLILSGTPEDATVNPFQKNAFDLTTPATTATTRDIFMTVTNAELLGKFKSSTKGLKTDGVFDVYRVDFYVAEPEPDNSFTVYQNSKDKKVAWARINFKTDKLSSTLNGGTKDLKIQRVQTIDGAQVKLTLYGTYTDEDDALKASTIYMVPLKVKDGFYHISKNDNEVIIAKAEKASDFTVTDVKVPVAITGYSSTDESLWTGLQNTKLFIAKNIMTNQQLIDKTASDGGTPVDIYRGTASIAEDLYIMSDPAKYNGFRIDKLTITKATDGDGVYINKGWYYMLLKKYATASATARVVWLDDSEATAIYGVKEIKRVEDGAIYTLQGVRVKSVNKGQIYIQNGKKFIAK